jgi:hypothetical protein
MDRENLADWSLELTDEVFPLALASLGVLAALERPFVADAYGTGAWRAESLPELFARALEGGSGVLKWEVPTVPARSSNPYIRIASSNPRRSAVVAVPEASALADVWRRFLVRTPRPNSQNALGPRLAVRSTARTIGSAMGFAWLLARPEVGAAGVYLDEAFPSDGRTDWHWPFTLATLPGDPLVDSLASLQRQFPPTWPFRFATASRDVRRIDILVIGAGASDALGRLLASGLRLRCCLVIVAGLGTDSSRTAEPLLRALAARVSAEGLAVLESGNAPQNFAERLKDFAYALTHNKTLDVALTDAFRPGVLLFLNRDLLALSHLDTTVAHVSKRLRKLPRNAEVLLSGRSFDRLGVPRENMRAAKPRMTTRAVPPEPAGAAAPKDVADAIDAARAHYRFESESGEASAVSELNRSVSAEETAAARRAGVPRYIQQKSFRKEAGAIVEERSGYVVGEPVKVQVYVGPKRDDSITAPTVFPEHKLPKNRDTHRLQVVFHEPRQFDQPMLREIILPRLGDSSVASFVFTPRAEGEFEGRISVLHRGRVLQTVLLHTRVVAERVSLPSKGSGITLEDETHVRHDWSDLGKRRQFDLAIVVNHTSTGASTLTGVAGKKAWATDLEGIKEPVRDINSALSKVAYSVTDYGSGLDQGENPALLAELARIGADLYSRLYVDQLGKLASDGFDVGSDDITYIQVVSARADAVLPLEFLYDFSPPPDPDAEVCPQHRDALKTGLCPGDCARVSSPRRHVCPMGFWGLKKVIERHMFDPKAAEPGGAQLVVHAVEALDGRDRLDLSSGALIGHSAEVKAAEVESLVHTLVARLGTNVPIVKDWDEWLTTVKAKHPALLVAFPHNEGRKRDMQLEIGGKKLFTLRLPADYVRPPEGHAPVVFLLGCDVAGTAEDFSHHITYFRQAGAAVVVSTIATVFGAHAVRVGEAIVSGLVQRNDTDKARIGEVIRDAKRAALLNSVPMALCVVAFGDADWRL